MGGKRDNHLTKSAMLAHLAAMRREIIRLEVILAAYPKAIAAPGVSLRDYLARFRAEHESLRKRYESP